MSDLLSLEEAAVELRVSEDWLRKAARRGTVPSRKVGQKRRFLPADLEAYLESVREGVDPMARSAASQARLNARRAS